MKDSIVSKEYEKKTIKEKLDLNWKGIRELFNKQNAKKIVRDFDDEILSYLAIEPGIGLLRDLDLFDDFKEQTENMDSFGALEQRLKEFLVFGLSEPFEINKKIHALEGKVGPYEIKVPKTSGELFKIGLAMKNCLKDIQVMEKYRATSWFVNLEFEGIPLIGVKFDEFSGILKCEDALYPGNRSIDPHEYYLIARLEEMIAPLLDLKMPRDVTPEDIEYNEDLLTQFERILR